MSYELNWRLLCELEWNSAFLRVVHQGWTLLVTTWSKVFPHWFFLFYIDSKFIMPINLARTVLPKQYLHKSQATCRRWSEHMDAAINPKQHFPRDARSCNIFPRQSSRHASTFRHTSWTNRHRSRAQTSHVRGAFPPRWPRRCISPCSRHSSIRFPPQSHSLRHWWIRLRRPRPIWP